MNNPLADPYFVLNEVYYGGKYLKRALAETPCEQINIARTTKIVYGVLEKDVYLSAIIAANCARKPKNAARLVAKIALYMLEFLGSPPHFVVNCAVALMKKLGKEGESGFLNALLRSYKLPPEPVKAVERLSLAASAPLWLAEKVKRAYKGEAEAVLSAPSLGVCVRFVRGADKYLSREHIPTPFENTYIFPHFTRDEGFFNGDYTFQSVGSAAICAAVEPCGYLLDACAAPGGKSVALAGKCGKIVACELHPHRVQLIKDYCARMGVENVTAVQADGTLFNPEYEGAFDGVLCDCPCTGTGVINENPDIKLLRRAEDAESLAKTQLAILSNCARYVKRGGRLYYSTCSVLPEENDGTAYNFLRLNDGFSVVGLSSPLENRPTKYGLQFLPHISLGAGFFIACFVKK